MRATYFCFTLLSFCKHLRIMFFNYLHVTCCFSKLNNTNSKNKMLSNCDKIKLFTFLFSFFLDRYNKQLLGFNFYFALRIIYFPRFSHLLCCSSICSFLKHTKHFPSSYIYRIVSSSVINDYFTKRDGNLFSDKLFLV